MIYAPHTPGDMSRRVLVTGTGRCRTAWAQAVLSGAGMNITHQGIKHSDCMTPQAVAMFGTSDVSFEAAPIASSLALLNWRIILLIRDPVDVIRSWLSLGAFTQAMHLTHVDWWKSMCLHCPEATITDDPVERALRFYIGWNRLALDADPEEVLWVEGLTAQRLGEVVLGPGTYADPGVIDNGTPGRLPIVLDKATQDMIIDRVADELGPILP